MKPLLLPYIFNIVVLIPVGLTTPFGGEAGRRLVFQGKLPEGAGIRTISGSFWTVIVIGSVIGLFHPVSMSPVLLIQVIYISLRLSVFVVPLLIRSSLWRSELGNRRDVLVHRPHRSLGHPVDQDVR